MKETKNSEEISFTPWCVVCSKSVESSSPVEIQAQDALPLIKFDLGRDSIKTHAELHRKIQEFSVYRASLIVPFFLPWAVRAVTALWVHAATKYAGIRVPSLEGTEIHFVSLGCSEIYQKTLGFEKIENPVIALTGLELCQFECLRPLESVKIAIQALGADSVPVEDQPKTGVFAGASPDIIKSLDKFTPLQNHAKRKALEQDSFLIRLNGTKMRGALCGHCHTPLINGMMD